MCEHLGAGAEPDSLFISATGVNTSDFGRGPSHRVTREHVEQSGRARTGWCGAQRGMCAPRDTEEREIGATALVPTGHIGTN